MRIFRYRLEITDYQELKLTSPRKILSVAPGRGFDPFARSQAERLGMVPAQSRADAIRQEYLDLWAIADEGGEEETTGIWILGTGHPIPELVIGTPVFHGSCVMPNSGLVWHVFSGPRQ